MRAIIIISKSIQMKVVPLYSQVWSKKILRPCPFLSTAQEHRHRHRTPTQDTSFFYLFSFICTHFISRHSTPECFIQICVNVHSNNATVLHLGKNFPSRMFTRLSEHLEIGMCQDFPEDNAFVLEVASAGENAVSLLMIEESHKNGPCSGAAALSCPVGHLDVAGGDRDANLVTEDRTHLRYAIGCSLLLLLWHLEHSQIPPP